MAPRKAHPFYADVDAVMLLTHAGDTASGARSGSLTAYERAYELGFRIFQVDVVAVAEDELLSMHSVFGRKRRLESGELSAARAAAGDDVPTLRELMERFTDVRWNVELKSVRCIDPLVVVLTELPDRRSVCVSAPFHTRLLRRLRRRFPDLATNTSLLEGALCGRNLLPWRQVDADGVQLFRWFATPGVVRRHTMAGRGVQAWPVDDLTTARRLRRRGVSGFIVNDYAAVAAILDDA